MNCLVSINYIVIWWLSLTVETTPPKVEDLTLPNNNNDPVILSWTGPELTDDNKEFFQGYNVSFSRAVLTFSQRRKRNIATMESQTVRVGPETTSYSYNISCPYNSSLTLCPYSRYCFSVVSLFEFRGTPIDASNATLAMMCNDTRQAGELTILEIVLYFNVVSYG